MGAKIKPSAKEYKRDARGKMTKQWTWKHYNVESISTKELKEFYLILLLYTHHPLSCG